MVPMLLASLIGCGPSPVGWKELPPLPDREGFAGSFAGVSGGALLVAGGANFPDKKPWDGGTKTWYDTVFVLDKPGAWKTAGKLPRPLGYGVSVSQGDGVVCVGGSDAARHYADAFRLTWRDGRLETTKLPPLPRAVANTSGALVGDTLFVAGGLEKPNDARTLKEAWAIDLSAREPQWRAIEAWPGRGRMLAVAAASDGAFWLAGGVDLVTGTDGKIERRYLKDAYRYDVANGWKRITDLPHPLAAAPATADEAGFTIFGGDDGSQLGVASDRHHGFSKSVLRFDNKSEKWSEADEMPASLVTTTVVRWDKAWIIPGGEIQPGVRSPKVWAFTPPAR